MNLLSSEYIAWDLETIADKSVIDKLPPAEETVKLGNLKDPVKIEAKIEQARIDQVAKMGLSPWTGRVCYFGAAYTGSDEIQNKGLILKAENDIEEKDLIMEIWSKLTQFGKFVTFNGNSFDIPFLIGRSIKLGVKPTVKISTAKYRITNHIDAYAVLTNFAPFAPGKLDFFCQVLLNEKKSEDGMTGDQVQGFWDVGRIDEIGDYCKHDALLTYKLAQKIINYGVI